MSRGTLALIVGAAFVLTLRARPVLQPRIRRVDPRKRYRFIAVLLGLGLGLAGLGTIAASHTGNLRHVAFLMVVAVLHTLACVLEMRNLRRAFSQIEGASQAGASTD